MARWSSVIFFQEYRLSGQACDLASLHLPFEGCFQGPRSKPVHGLSLPVSERSKQLVPVSIFMGRFRAS